VARMHSRKRGRSRSTKPLSKKPPPWCKMTSDEVEALVVKYAKEGNRPGTIGTILRDQHAVPLVKQITGKPVTQILRDNKLVGEVPEDLSNLVDTAARMNRHLTRFKSDRMSVHRLQLVESKIHRLSKYYKRKGVLPQEWKPRYTGAA